MNVRRPFFSVSAMCTGIGLFLMFGGFASGSGPASASGPDATEHTPDVVVEPIAAVFALTPVWATGTHTIVDNRITVERGSTVALEILISRWDPALLKIWQVMVDGENGYPSGRGRPLAHAVRPCGDDAECESAFGPGSTCRSMCLGGDNEWLDCYSNDDCPDGTCEATCDFAFQSTNREDFVLPWPSVSAVDVGIPSRPRFGSTTFDDCLEDDGETHYGGTLVLTVPMRAAGVYEIAFDVVLEQTFMTDCAYIPIPVAEYVPAVIIVGNTH